MPVFICKMEAIIVSRFAKYQKVIFFAHSFVFLQDYIYFCNVFGWVA